MPSLSLSTRRAGIVRLLCRVTITELLLVIMHLVTSGEVALSREAYLERRPASALVEIPAQTCEMYAQTVSEVDVGPGTRRFRHMQPNICTIRFRGRRRCSTGARAGY